MELDKELSKKINIFTMYPLVKAKLIIHLKLVIFT